MKMGDVGELFLRLSPGSGRITLLGNQVNILIREVPERPCSPHTHTPDGGLGHPAVRWAQGYHFSCSEDIARVYQRLLVVGFPPPQRLKPHAPETPQWVLMYYQVRCCQVATAATASSSPHCCQNGWSFPYRTSSDSPTWDCIASAFVFLEEF